MSFIPSGKLEVLNLMDLRTLAMCVLAYAGFLRFNELSHIKLEHLSFSDDTVNIFIPTSKTYIYRDGMQVLIGKGESCACPVRILKSYISLAQVLPHQFIFRSLSKTKVGFKLRDKNQPISYTRARELILAAYAP